MVLKGTLIPRMVMARPSAVAIGVDWPVELIDFNESVTAVSFEYISEVFMTHVGIELVECSATAPLVIRISRHIRGSVRRSAIVQ